MCDYSTDKHHALNINTFCFGVQTGISESLSFEKLFNILQIIKPLCEDIETNLRLHAHSHLQTQEISLQSEKPDCKDMLTIPPLIFFHRFINLKGKLKLLTKKVSYYTTNNCIVSLNALLHFYLYIIKHTLHNVNGVYYRICYRYLSHCFILSTDISVSAP